MYLTLVNQFERFLASRVDSKKSFVRMGLTKAMGYDRLALFFERRSSMTEWHGLRLPVVQS
jgi:hypothetical protein